MTLRLTTRVGHPTFTDLAWETSLVEWESSRLVTPVRGISRHVVRFVAYGPDMYALKEIPDRLVAHEYSLLRELSDLAIPVVEAVGMVTGRVDVHGNELDGVLLTKHLSYSLPYRSLFARDQHSALWSALIDALAQLLVRIHLVGFFWGDCSLSNALFRRDAGALAAYLVDAETGEVHESLSRGQRHYDIDIAVENMGGELLDLQTPGEFSLELDPLDVVSELPGRYENLWFELTRDEVGPSPEGQWVGRRVRRLNQLGFDVRELEISEADDGWHLALQTYVMEQGHNSRRLLSLTGLDAQENQARRLLNDIEVFRDRIERQDGVRLSDPVAALRWLVEVFQPTVDLVPPELRDRLEPAELFHQIIQHRWYMSEHIGEDVGMPAAVAGYVNDVLRDLPSERSLVEAAGEPPATE